MSDIRCNVIIQYFSFRSIRSLSPTPSTFKWCGEEDGCLVLQSWPKCNSFLQEPNSQLICQQTNSQWKGQKGHDRQMAVWVRVCRGVKLPVKTVERQFAFGYKNSAKNPTRWYGIFKQINAKNTKKARTGIEVSPMDKWMKYTRQMDGWLLDGWLDERTSGQYDKCIRDNYMNE